MTIIINKSHCIGGITCGHCRRVFGVESLPDAAHNKPLKVEADDPELLIECPKGAIMWRGDSDGEV
jgi:ferredoxin